MHILEAMSKQFSTSKRFLTPAVSAALAIWLSGIACVLCCNLFCVSGERSDTGFGLEISELVTHHEGAATTPAVESQEHSCCSDSLAENTSNSDGEESVRSISKTGNPACCPLMKAGRGAGFLPTVPTANQAASVSTPSLPRLVSVAPIIPVRASVHSNRGPTYLRCCVLLI